VDTIYEKCIASFHFLIAVLFKSFTSCGKYYV